MSLITVSSLSKSFGAEDIFAGVTFTVAKGARLALVGPNGIGKTTLLRILDGDEEPSTGQVTRSKNLRIGYLSQEADFELGNLSLWVEGIDGQQVGGSFGEVPGEEDHANGGFLGHGGAHDDLAAA